jgi:hypothetical protein
MAESSYNCSVVQGFNFEKDAQVILGFVNSLKIDTQELNSDIAVSNPEDITGAKLKVFGVLSSIFWAGGYTDAVSFSCQVSSDNQELLNNLIHSKLNDTAVELEFTVYDYDFKAKKYYKRLHCEGTKLKGLIHKEGGALQMKVANEFSSEVAAPKNFSFRLGVMPAEDAGADQFIHLSHSLSAKLPKQWGVLVGK